MFGKFMLQSSYKIFTLELLDAIRWLELQWREYMIYIWQLLNYVS